MNHTLNRTLISIILVYVSCISLAAREPPSPDDIQIIEGEEKTIYEYRNNGVLLMIKVVPKNKKRRPYYMVPGDGSAHYTSLDHHKKLYPQWVVVEW
tara:strand:- start:1014 stop:1304 length:291 start_codon:yes stop_codon:yes gene_type:complete